MTTNLTSSDVARSVYGHLGLTLTAFIANTRRRADARDWANGESIPNEDQLQRLTVALEVFNMVADRDGDELARRVMIGSGAMLNGEEASPAMVIRVGEFDAARIAAQRYLEDAWR